jgi:hypothetical protein
VNRLQWGASIIAVLSMAFVGVVLYADFILLSYRGKIVPAAVLDEWGTKTRSGPTIEVRYVTRGGQTVVDTTSNFKGSVNVGDQIDVVYDPKNPQRMQAADYGFDHFSPAVWLIGAAGLALWTWRRDWSRDPDPP